SFSACPLKIYIDGELVHTHMLDLPANGNARPVGSLTHRLAAQPRQISLTLHRRAELLAQNRYDLAWSDESRPGLALRLRRRLADWLLW
ncbi:MAG: hypothetical protein AB1801_11605, partial [Chloroflexota bacterium]